MINRKLTTHAIKAAYHASHSLEELEEMAFSNRDQLARQAPYFDARLLDRQAKLEQVIKASITELELTS